METVLHPNGRVKSITYRVNGRRHRDNGPAYQKWNDAGELIREDWHQNGRLHRDNGPAYQKWNDAGELIVEMWYQNNRKLTPQEIEKILRPENIMAALREGLPQPIFEEIAAIFRVV
jgi:antitoxin component YwqK of YwqJK toxin-antitoxin module